MVRSLRSAGYHPREHHGSSRSNKHSERCTNSDSHIGSGSDSPEKPCGHGPGDPFVEYNPLKQLSNRLGATGLNEQQ
jgi:hypothetical protein